VVFARSCSDSKLALKLALREQAVFLPFDSLQITSKYTGNVKTATEVEVRAIQDHKVIVGQNKGSQ
jgi:hypothetical protein